MDEGRIFISEYNDQKSKSFRDEQGYTILMLAVDLGLLNVVEYLLNNGHDPNIELDDGITALWIAASAGHNDIAHVLIKNGANVNQRGSVEQISPVFLAIKNSDITMLKTLIENGANLTFKDGSGSSIDQYIVDEEIRDFLKNYYIK
jgi:ankyrin repeat protein